MKHLSIHIVLIICSLLPATSAYAQTKPALPIDTLAAREALSMKEKLHLSDAQQKLVAAESKRYQQELQQYREGAARLDKSARMAQIDAIRNEHYKALKQILSAEQWNDYETGVEKNRAVFLQQAKEKKIRVEAVNE